MTDEEPQDDFELEMRVRGYSELDEGDVSAKEMSRVAEASYRRGCHQTAFKLANLLEEYDNIHKARGMVNDITNIIGDMRYDRKSHVNFLDEAFKGGNDGTKHR